MTGIALLLAAAALGFGVARALDLPAIPVLLLSGLAISFVGGIEELFLQDALVLGITFLVFVAGVELNPGRVHQQKWAAVQVGLVQFLTLGGLGFWAATLLGFDLHSAIYLALALTASSTLVVVRILQQRRQLFEPFGRMIIGVLLLQDFLVITLMPVVTLLPEGLGSVLGGVGATAAMMGLTYTLMRWVLPVALRRLSLDEELLLLAVLVLLFTFLFLARSLGLPTVAGAFMAGVALSSFPVNGVVRGQLSSIAHFFTAIFFTALGATLGIPSVAQLLQAGALALVVLLFTPPLVTVVAERIGFSARPAIFSGLVLSQTSEFSLVVGLQGVVLEQIAPGTFTVIALVTLVTMMLTPLLAGDRVSLTLMHLHPARFRRRAPPVPPENHVLLLGCGATGLPLLETLVIAPHPVVVVDDDPRVVRLVREAGIEAVRGDATDAALLARVGADRARVVVSTVRRIEDNGPLLDLVPDSRRVLVRAFDIDDARWVEQRGGRAVLYSDAAAEEFLAWFRKGGWEAAADPTREDLQTVL